MAAINGTVTTAGSQTLAITTKGENKKLVQVKLVPEIGRSLLSVGQLTDDPLMDLRFKGKEGTSSHNGEEIAKGEKGNDNLYRIFEAKHKNHVPAVSVGDHTSDNAISDDNKSKTDSSEDYRDNVSNSLKSWHHRLGYLSKTGLEHLTRMGMLSNSKRQFTMPLECVMCAQGKSYPKAYKRRPKKCKIRKTRAGEQIYLDRCGPFSVMGVNAESYFQTYIDDYTRITIAFLM